ncbi:organic cation transporter protein-like [Galendromus occidentalis]|uniref:Organic cation transporter protein-like n=1 Tax=Galendromus occidentalis TaxID=34638 RepID=A0AAJ6QUW4_9ACAR|nr:organic cation transporter protein-like [Galendromus occidentalis]
MEEIFREVGPWHTRIFLIAILGHVPFGLFVMSMSFMAPKLDFTCKTWAITLPPEPAVNSTYNRCYFKDDEQVIKCIEWDYDHRIHKRTLIEEWNAVCDRAWIVSLAQGMLMLGMLVGCFVFALVSDWYGRKPSFIAAQVITIMSGFASSFTPAFGWFCFLRFIAAMGHGGKRMANTLAVESVGSGQRAVVTVGQDLGWCIGMLATPLVTYFVRDWVWIQRLVVLPEFFFLYLAIVVDESPKWLLSAGRFEEARQILHQIVERNKLDPNIDVDLIVETTRGALMHETHMKKGSIRDLLREKHIMILTTSFWIQFLVVILVYYQMIYYIVEISEDSYLSVIYMGLIEIPATLSAWYIVKTYHRKPVYNFFYTSAIIATAALMSCPEGAATIKMLIANVGKLAFIVLYNCLAVHVAECYPTKVRSVAIGTSQTASRIGAVVAPFLLAFSIITAEWVPLALALVLTAIAAFCSLSLPETFGKELPNTFHEMKILLHTERKSRRTEEMEATESKTKELAQTRSTDAKTANNEQRTLPTS